MAENRCSDTLTTPKKIFGLKRVSNNSESISKKKHFPYFSKTILVEIIKNVEKKFLRKNHLFLGDGCFWTVFDRWSLPAWLKIWNLILTWPKIAKIRQNHIFWPFGTKTTINRAFCEWFWSHKRHQIQSNFLEKMTKWNHFYVLNWTCNPNSSATYTGPS